MARVTEGDVRAIYDTVASSPAIEAAIDSAHRLLDREIPATSTYGADTLADLERWIAAHLLHGPDPIEVRGQTGDSRSEFATPNEVLGGLGETRYGRVALTIDTEGHLSPSDKPKATWGGFGADADLDRHTR